MTATEAGMLFLVMFAVVIFISSWFPSPIDPCGPTESDRMWRD